MRRLSLILRSWLILRRNGRSRLGPQPVVGDPPQFFSHPLLADAVHGLLDFAFRNAVDGGGVVALRHEFLDLRGQRFGCRFIEAAVR